MNDNLVAELTHRLEQAEDENDALVLQLAVIEDAVAGGERVPLKSWNGCRPARRRCGSGASAAGCRCERSPGGPASRRRC